MSKYETSAGKVSRADTYKKLVELLREAQDQALILGHMDKADDEMVRGQGFLAMGELLGRAASQVTKLAVSGRTKLIIN